MSDLCDGHRQRYGYYGFSSGTGTSLAQAPVEKANGALIGA